MTKGALRFFAGSFCHIAALGAPAAYLFLYMRRYIFILQEVSEPGFSSKHKLPSIDSDLCA